MRDEVRAADAAMKELLAEGNCGPIVDAIVSKYIALSPDEVSEWQVEIIFWWGATCSAAGSC